MNLVKVSKFLSYVLRHKPESIGLTLDNNGWTDIDELIRCASKHGKNISKETILEVVKVNNKQRFGVSSDGKKIRARQGHSINIDLELKSTEPPDILYHGTTSRFLNSILETGLTPQRRHHVHLSSDYETAIKVGIRHGEPVIFEIDTKTMQNAGYKFYISENNVWLTDHVPPEYLKVISLP